jgi:hypothetical protein
MRPASLRHHRPVHMPPQAGAGDRTAAVGFSPPTVCARKPPSSLHADAACWRMHARFLDAQFHGRIKRDASVAPSAPMRSAG